MKRISLMFLFAFCVFHFSFGQESERMQWFKEAKLGIFIHWGIYAVNGIDESWSFYNELLPYEDYMKQLDGFGAEKYDPQAWAGLIRESGARYAVLTSKHHDGVALWDTDAGDLSVVKKTPAGKDLIGPFCSALRAEGMKVGLYYSLLDWSHPDYPNFIRNRKRYERDSFPSRWDNFDRFNRAQITEITTRYNPDLVWFDGDWEQSAEVWKAAEIREMLLNNNTNVIINSRLQGYGDYATPEQGIPVSRPKDEYWELCMTMNDSWGFQPNDTNYKPVNLIIRIFADVIGMGGNLLLDIGPKADGTIPEEQVAILKELGRWTSKHSEAIYGTLAGLPKDCYYGPSTLSADSTVLFLFVPGTGTVGQLDSWTVGQENNPAFLQSYNPTVLLKGITSKINSIRVVGNGTKLDQTTWLKPWWSSNPGLIGISIPAEAMDAEMTVITVEFEGKLKVKF
ncbi:MAG: alpha-L-fucosidase [Bacteroidales bacterium]|nr:alpha-L-fucosidase [Bacteroidales bacterium]